MPRLGGAVDLPQVNDPASPVAGRQFLYFKSDGLLYTKTSAGTVSQVGSGAAPTNMVTTDTAQSITGTKTFGSGRLVVNDGTDDLLRVSTIDGMTVQTSGVFPLTVGRTVLASAGEPFINAAIQGKTAYWTGSSSSSTTWVGLTFAHRSASANDRVVRAGSSLEVSGASSATGAALRVNNNTAAQDIVDFRDSTGVARMTVSNAGVLNASSQVQENGVRVFSPNNPPVSTVTSVTTTHIAVAGTTVLANGTFTVTLPFLPSSGAQVTVKNTGTGVVTVTRNGVTIDGATTFVLDIQYASVTVVSDGTNWFVI